MLKCDKREVVTVGPPGLGDTKLQLGVGVHDKLHDSVVGSVQIMN